MFGALVDAFGTGLRVKEGSAAETTRLVLCMMLSTGMVGFAAYYVTAVATSLVPNDFLIDLTVLIFGVVSGAIGGAAAARLWNRNLMVRLQGN
jgi:hypothetical protein